MNICGMFGHKVKGTKNKMYLHVDEGKSFDFGDTEKYLEENGELSIQVTGRTKSREAGNSR